MSIKAPKKLIEVALPLDDINEAAAYEKLPGIGAHPRGIHHWWARRPLTAARAIIFAQMVNDPGGERGYFAGKTKEQAAIQREELFEIIRDLVKWSNSNSEAVLKRARAAIAQSWRETCELNKGRPGFDPDNIPAFHDPFAGGGALPLEAQRLSLHPFASDLNPLAVVINKAMIEIPAIFAGRPPVGPRPEATQSVADYAASWTKALGLAEDMRRFGAWIQQEVVQRLASLYPRVNVVSGQPVTNADSSATTDPHTVVAWLWARTVKSPNPAFSSADVPLISNYILSSKSGREVWLEPVVKGDSFEFVIKRANVDGHPPLSARKGTKASDRGSDFVCLLSGTPVSGQYIKAEGQAGRLGARLVAVVADSKRGRIYVPATREMEAIAMSAAPSWSPSGSVPARLTGGTCYSYGLTEWKHLFTKRQLVCLSTISNLIQEVRPLIRQRALDAGWADDGIQLHAGGTGATAYADAICLYLSLGLGRTADFNNTATRWSPSNQKVMNLFGQQSIPMVWDYAEANTLAKVVGGWINCVEYQAECIETLPVGLTGQATQIDAQTQVLSRHKVISTDPPYYDNIGYADLADFFYVWLRPSLRPLFPELFATLVVPKAEELVASAYRHGGAEAAEAFFMNGMTSAMRNLAEQAHPAYPVTIYYAFKASKTSEIGTENTGWETFLQAVLDAGFGITGTWPLRSEQTTRKIGAGANALASSIVLVCRKRDQDAPAVSRRDFIRELKSVLPQALEDMTHGAYGRSPVAPVDLAQAIIGPGMEVFSKYSAVLEADGTPMAVHTALTLINTYLPGDPDEFDAATRFCLTWFETYGWSRDQFGEADVLARAKGTSVDHIAEAGVLESGAGKVKLLRATEYPADWQPEKDAHTPVWEAAHHLIRAHQAGGDAEAGALLARMPDQTEKIRQLAYRLYTLCERNGWAEEARSYNELMTAWTEITNKADEIGRSGSQGTFDV